jgi:uncharacterized membrane protein YadS
MDIQNYMQQLGQAARAAAAEVAKASTAAKNTALLAMAMAALGLTTHVSALKKAGAKPLLMALVLFIWLIVGGGAINLAVHSLMA